MDFYAVPNPCTIHALSMLYPCLCYGVSMERLVAATDFRCAKNTCGSDKNFDEDVAINIIQIRSITMTTQMVIRYLVITL